MKLTENLKNKIDNYFDNITPEELLNVLESKCGFSPTSDEITITEENVETWANIIMKKFLTPDNIVNMLRQYISTPHTSQLTGVIPANI